MSKNIVLVGFMGTGKTTVAKILSQRLKMHYVSTDDIIEKRQKRPITDIFAKDGEEYFRDVEQKAIADASVMKDAVIDVGGGAVIKEENIKNLKKNGVIVCLAASSDVILERTKNEKHRPLLNIDGPKERIEELLASRARYYARADFTIDTSRLTVDEVVEKVIQCKMN